jgi:hypothetical protein
VESITSRVVAAMKGRIMIARTSEAVIRPTPSGGAENQKNASPSGGIHAKASVSQG